MILHTQNCDAEIKRPHLLPRERFPNTHCPIGAGAGQFLAVSAPAERDNRMHVPRNQFGHASCRKVPDANPPIVAAHREQGPLPIEGTHHGDTDAVQRAMIFLQPIKQSIDGLHPISCTLANLPLENSAQTNPLQSKEIKKVKKNKSKLTNTMLELTEKLHIAGKRHFVEFLLITICDPENERTLQCKI